MLEFTELVYKTRSEKCFPVKTKSVMAAAHQEEVETEEKGYHKLSTVGFDARFPNQNQVSVIH